MCLSIHLLLVKNHCLQRFLCKDFCGQLLSFLLGTYLKINVPGHRLSALNFVNSQTSPQWFTGCKISPSRTKTWTPSFAENIVNKQLTKFLPKMCLRCKESFGSQEWFKNVRQVRAMNTKCRRHSSGLWMNASSFYLLPTYIHRWFKNSLYWPRELGILSDERHNF